MAEKLLLKKYPNRRLYDTEKSTYVSLKHVADKIRQGRTVEVIDVKTKENVTAFVLTQIILEEARDKNIVLPAPFLQLIIQYGDNVLAEFFQNYLQITVESYLAFKSDFDNRFRKWLEMGMNISDMAHRTMRDLTPFQSFMDSFSTSRGTESKNDKGK